MSKLLEKLAYICLIGMCLVSGTILIRSQWLMNKSRSEVQENPAVALVGKKLQIAGVDWNSSQLSAVLYLSTSCHFCKESMPFYRRLVAQHREGYGRNIALLVVSAEPNVAVNDYLKSEHVGIDRVYQVPLPNDLLRGTPTLMLVDARGVIVWAELGQLNPSSESEILDVFKTGKFGDRPPRG